MRASAGRLLLLLGATAALSAPVAAEEVLILDNGTVLKGEVLEDGHEDVVVRLDGLRGEGRVTVERKRIVRRFRTGEDPALPSSPRPLVPDVPPGRETPVGEVAEVAAERLPSAEAPAPPRRKLPVEQAPEPTMDREGFFQRLARVAWLGLPRDVTGRATLACLVFVGLMTLIALGGRIAEVETLGFGRNAALALLLGLILGADIVGSRELLRADRAIWVLPVQAVAWFTAAIGILRESAGRVVLLFAFVLFSLTVAVFTAGAILVSA